MRPSDAARVFGAQLQLRGPTRDGSVNETYQDLPKGGWGAKEDVNAVLPAGFDLCEVDRRSAVSARVSIAATSWFDSILSCVMIL